MSGLSIQLPVANHVRFPYDEHPPSLIFRACDKGVEAKIHADAGTEIILESRHGFVYCPWCGKQLVEFPTIFEMRRAATWRRLLKKLGLVPR